MCEIKLSKAQNITVATVSSLGMITVYGTGVNLARTFMEHHNPIFATTIVCSFISPYLLAASTEYVLKKYNQRTQQKQLKKKGDEL